MAYKVWLQVVSIHSLWWEEAWNWSITLLLYLLNVDFFYKIQDGFIKIEFRHDLIGYINQLSSTDDYAHYHFKS